MLSSFREVGDLRGKKFECGDFREQNVTSSRAMYCHASGKPRLKVLWGNISSMFKFLLHEKQG